MKRIAALLAVVFTVSLSGCASDSQKWANQYKERYTRQSDNLVINGADVSPRVP